MYNMNTSLETRLEESNKLNKAYNLEVKAMQRIIATQSKALETY